MKGLQSREWSGEGWRLNEHRSFQHQNWKAPSEASCCGCQDQKRQKEVVPCIGSLVRNAFVQCGLCSFEGL